MRRFGIRDLLWFTTVVAVALGWWIDHAKLSYDFLIEQNQHQALYRDFHSLRATAQMLEEDLNALQSAQKD